MKKCKSKLLQALHAVRDEIFVSVRLQLSDETLTYKQIADANGISLATVQRVAERSGISRPVGPRPRSRATLACNLHGTVQRSATNEVVSVIGQNPGAGIPPPTVHVSGIGDVPVKGV